jgi:glutaredoxin 3
MNENFNKKTMANVLIYTKSYCPFSKDCKEFFDAKGVSYDEKIVDDPALLTEMSNKSGQRTDTPQVFINDHHIGSFDDIKALEQTEKLDEMLNS